MLQTTDEVVIAKAECNVVSAASRHTTTPITHTMPSHRSPCWVNYSLFPVPVTVEG